ncbi:uncharacterized protein KY384_004002 [Bacidia gigantensis]|uniref:uncharacterized protein n=1 Tax=Bacidia gigantensis TaxID=2732470 RepID=UPI001D04C059|nr:uncharacterized protein KY384_004002 [Bacidia gigantensis]KAG8530647.1 hypothetical protein KY384_004002 [Bacidia gigantensis]
MPAEEYTHGQATNASTESLTPGSTDAHSDSISPTTTAQSSPASNYTHPVTLNNSHVDSLQVFIDDVNCALTGALARGGSAYSKVTVLFLRWADDVFVDPGVNNGVQGEIDSLEKVLVDEYGFESEICLIPSHKPQLSLMRRIMDFQEAHDSVEELLLVYYGGHGVLNDLNQSIWSQGNGPIIEWFSIQPILEHAASDILILLDCCFAASAGLTSINGSVEVLAACGREVGTVGISGWSFTSRLTEVLYKKRLQRFTVAQLHSDLMGYRAVSGEKKLLRTPVHGIMSNKDKASVRISSLKTDSDIEDLEELNLTTLEDSVSVKNSSSRVLISVSIEGDLDQVAWRDWLLSQLPSGISGLSLVRPEGIWRSHSSLGLFSLPIALWDLLANKPAYAFVGYVTTPNIIHEIIPPSILSIIYPNLIHSELPTSSIEDSAHPTTKKNKLFPRHTNYWSEDKELHWKVSMSQPPKYVQTMIISPKTKFPPSQQAHVPSRSDDSVKSFSKIVARGVDAEADIQIKENEFQRGIYKKLVDSANTANKTWTESLRSFSIPRFTQAPMPTNEELKSIVCHYYPPRAILKCHVCDFGDGRAEHRIVELGKLEEYMIVKPDWVDVRWIHAPLGSGLMQSSLEDVFLHLNDRGQGREFVQLGKSVWNYLESEIFNFKDQDYFQEMRDIYALFHDREELRADLDILTWNGDENASLHPAVDWRAKHLATDAGFWNLVSSDIPCHLSEEHSMGSPGTMDGLKSIDRHVEKQTLSLEPFYGNAQLARDPFRTFHRGDGFLLTLSPMNGVNYLDENFAKYLKEPADSRFDNDDASAIGHCFHAFANTGSSTWHRRTVEYFLTYLLTETLTTPHAMRQGFNALPLSSAYRSIVQELKRGLLDEREPKEKANLKREYLTCMDELRCITASLKKKLKLFKVMQIDIENFEAEDLRNGKLPDHVEGESATERIHWAIDTVESDYDSFERLLADLQHLLDEVSCTPILSVPRPYK